MLDHYQNTPPLNWMDNRSHITARIAKERQLLHQKKNRKKMEKKMKSFISLRNMKTVLPYQNTSMKDP